MMWTVYEQGQNSYEVEGDTREEAMEQILDVMGISVNEQEEQSQ